MRHYPLLLSLSLKRFNDAKKARRAAARAAKMVAALSVMLAIMMPVSAMANCLARSQSVLTVVEAADAYTIIKTVQAGHVGYDRMAPFCASKPLREIACQGALNLAIRVVEKPTAKTCLLNYAAAIGYSLYIRKALGAQFGFRL